MTTNLKNIVISLSFLVLITGVLLANLLLPDREYSLTERRRFSSMPGFSVEKLLDGKVFLEFEKYSLEQFALRDQFRNLKALSRYYLLRQGENNGVHLAGTGLYKPDPLNERSVRNAAAKLNEVYDMYLKGMNVYYSVIPDKSSLTGPEYLAMDFSRLQELMQDNVEHMTYLDIADSLSLGDYYRTDKHWRQEKIVPIAEKILIEIGGSPQKAEYRIEELSPFYGPYYGRGGLLLPADSIGYLRNDTIDNAVVYDYERNSYVPVYNLEMFESMDQYNFFLSGPSALMYVENPSSQADRELILFRDSFGSSIAPLLLEGYSRIYLVDLRYISSRLLGEYIEFTPNQDVLFLLSTPILNNSNMLK